MDVRSTNGMATAFLAGVLDDPADDGVRLIFADWLDEHGDPDRAEFIRVQCELAGWQMGPCACLPPGYLCQRCALRRRERDLLSGDNPGRLPSCTQPRPGWAGPLPDVLPWDMGGWVFRRGFVEEVSIAWAGWRAWGAGLVRGLPLRAVRLLGKEPTGYPASETVKTYWRWFDGSRAGGPDSCDPDDLPGELWPFYAAEMDARQRTWEHPGRADAEACLSAAALAWARSVVTTAPAPVN
jgi:uncharacterized protein (TIGR02996 family)